MPRHPIELARKHYEGLPAILKQALFSTEIAEKMFEIGKKFGLTIEKTGIMAEETGYIMLGLTRPNELVGNLASELGTGTDQAQDIAAEINHQIFFPLREELKRTHDFDMGADEVVGSGGATRVSGMQMPSSIKKTLVEEKSPLVSDLTRVKEVVMPSFQPPASPTGRIDDLQKMVEKPPLPIAKPKEIPEIPASFPKSAPKPPVVSPVEPPAVSTVEPWEKDMEKEVSSPLTQKPAAQPPQPKESLPIDLRPQQKFAVLPPPIQTKLPPIDLRPTPTLKPAPPSVPRMTPQLQDLARQTSGQNINKGLPSNKIGPTLLEERLWLEPQEKVAPQKSVRDAAPARSVGVPTTKDVGTGSDPYREPVGEE